MDWMGGNFRCSHWRIIPGLGSSGPSLTSVFDSTLRVEGGGGGVGDSSVTELYATSLSLGTGTWRGGGIKTARKLSFHNVRLALLPEANSRPLPLLSRVAREN